jgi:choline dehydrogenase-like flavoprotein
VRRARVRTLAGNEFAVHARVFILATGGIANAQLLLASNSVAAAGLGNAHDLVGRYFMEHPHHNRSARLLPTARFRVLPFYERHTQVELTAMGVLFLTDETKRRERLLSLNLSFHPRDHRDAPGYASCKHGLGSLRRRSMPDDFGAHLRNVLRGLDEVAGGVKRKLQRRPPFDYEISWRSEQSPNPASRVQLLRERDTLGMPRVRLDWNLTNLDLRTIRRTQEIVAAELGRAGIGRIRLPVDDGSHAWAADLVGGSHHMGTTRMARDPQRGVVDATCRVHGVGNLYVAGSSVFPTCGSANPTLTIVALALRLADHVRKELG